VLTDYVLPPLGEKEKNPCGLLDRPVAADRYDDLASHGDSGVLQGARPKQHTLERRLKQSLEHTHAAADALPSPVAELCCHFPVPRCEVKWAAPKTSQDLSKPHSPGHSVDPNLGCEVYTTPKTSQPRLPSAASRLAQSHEASRPKRICPDVPPSDGLRVIDAADAAATDTHGPNQGAQVDVDHDAQPHRPKTWSTNPPLSAVEQGTSYSWRDHPRQTSQAQQWQDNPSTRLSEEVP